LRLHHDTVEVKDTYDVADLVCSSFVFEFKSLPAQTTKRIKSMKERSKIRLRLIRAQRSKLIHRVFDDTFMLLCRCRLVDLRLEVYLIVDACERTAEKVEILEGTAIETSLYREQGQVEFERSLIVTQAVQSSAGSAGASRCFVVG